MIPFATYQAAGRSRSLNASRLVNMYPEIAVIDSRARLVLRSAPGLLLFTLVGTGPIRGLHVMNATLFAVSGTSLYSIASDGVATLLGAAGTIAGTGFVHMQANAASELVITNSAGAGWVWDTSTLASLSALDPDFGDDASSVTFLDQYHIYSRKDTGQVFVSALNNAKSYNSLAFGTAEFAPDNVAQVFADNGQLVVLGDDTTEFWYNTNASPMPFARVPGAILSDIGGVNHTAASVDQTVYWLGTDGIVYRSPGNASGTRRVSTHEIENRIAAWTNPRGFTYKEEGHAFYVISADQGAVVYDAATNLWHERNTFSAARWRVCTYAKCYGKHFVGDYSTGVIFEMSKSYHAEGSNDMQRQIISQPLENDGKPVFVNELQLHFEHGVGLTSGQGSDPEVILEWSDDGGNTWSNEYRAKIGKKGKYGTRAIWRRLGRCFHRVFRVTFSDPVPFTLYGVDLK